MSVLRRRLLMGRRKLDLEWPLHNLPELQAWYTFDDADYLFTDAGTTNVTADGDKIYQCNDRSGNDRHVVQATESNRPVWKTRIQSGRSVSRWNSHDTLHNAAPGDLLRNVSGATVVAVVNHATASKDGICYVLTNGEGARVQMILRDVNIGDISIGGRREDDDGYASVQSAAGAYDVAEWFSVVARVVYSSAKVYIYKDNNVVLDGAAFQTAGNTSDMASSKMGVGTDASTLGFEGDIGEAIICGADIGYSLLRALWQQYLGPKWNLRV